MTPQDTKKLKKVKKEKGKKEQRAAINPSSGAVDIAQQRSVSQVMGSPMKPPRKLTPAPELVELRANVLARALTESNKATGDASKVSMWYSLYEDLNRRYDFTSLAETDDDGIAVGEGDEVEGDEADDAI